MKKINVIQFLPYFLPHKWWIENVSEEFSIFYTNKWYWKVINIVFDIWQNVSNEDFLIFDANKNIVWYKNDWYSVYLLPSFEIISNFPVPKIWKKDFWKIIKITSELSKHNNTIIQTHTRFFLSSFLWWLFAKYNKLKWVHVEHWSDYVKLWSKLKTKIAFIYDKIIWFRIFSKANCIISISEGVKKFIKNEFVNREINVIYNWISFHPWRKKDSWVIIKIWFVWRLVKLKWVLILLKSFQKLSKKYDNLELDILWDWDERIILEKYVSNNNLKNVKFLWFQNREFIASEFLPQIDILVNPSFQEWLPTTVLEWLLSSCVVVATDVGGTSEISDRNDLIIVENWSTESLEKWLEIAINNYKEFTGLSLDLIKEKFDWDKNIEKYFNLYTSLK